VYSALSSDYPHLNEWKQHQSPDYSELLLNGPVRFSVRKHHENHQNDCNQTLENHSSAVRELLELTPAYHLLILALRLSVGMISNCVVRLDSLVLECQFRARNWMFLLYLDEVENYLRSLTKEW